MERKSITENSGNGYFIKLDESKSLLSDKIKNLSATRKILRRKFSIIVKSNINRVLPLRGKT